MKRKAHCEQTAKLCKEFFHNNRSFLPFQLFKFVLPSITKGIKIENVTLEKKTTIEFC